MRCMQEASAYSEIERVCRGQQCAENDCVWDSSVRLLQGTEVCGERLCMDAYDVAMKISAAQAISL